MLVVELVLDVSRHQRRLAHGALAQQHDFERIFAHFEAEKLTCGSVLSSPGPSSPRRKYARLASPSRASSPTRASSPRADRFIPEPEEWEADWAQYAAQEQARPKSPPNSDVALVNATERYRQAVESNLVEAGSGLLSPASPGRRRQASRGVVRPREPRRFADAARTDEVRLRSPLGGVPDRARAVPVRTLPTEAERTLDAPDLVDDYYLNLLDWSSQNVVAVALGATVYLWDASTQDVTRLTELDRAGETVASLRFAPDGRSIAVGTSASSLLLYDVATQRRTREMGGHQLRIGSLSWNPTVPDLLSSGSRDSKVVHHDVRAPRHNVATLEGHLQEVCGLQWSLDGQQLASGGNDNRLLIWDWAASSSGRHSSPRFTFTRHNAAVKALAWCPFRDNLLASGGGTVDRCIKFWNTSTGQCLNSVDTLSQVCALQWSTAYRDLVSSHGFSNNQLIVWNYPSMTKVGEITGHNARVLHMAKSPDETTVVSGAADGSLRFWHLFPSDTSPFGPSTSNDLNTQPIYRSLRYYSMR